MPDDFVIDETTHELVSCPAGHASEITTYNEETGTHTAQMAKAACNNCPFLKECPVREASGRFEVKITNRQRRLDARRREQDTEAFRKRYRKRSGIEGTNSGVKRRTGMARLRVRGSPAVFASILLKVTGWNILRAAASMKMRAWMANVAPSALAGATDAPLASLGSASTLVFVAKIAQIRRSGNQIVRRVVATISRNKIAA